MTETISLETMPNLYPALRLKLYLQSNFQDILHSLRELAAFTFSSFWVTETNFIENEIFFPDH